MGSVNSRTFSRVTSKRGSIQVMMEINEKCDKKKPVFLSDSKLCFILLFLNDFWTIRWQTHPQQWTVLLLAPSDQNVLPDRCILSLYICVTMQQQFIFPTTHSIHTLQTINIPSDYRFTFCLAIFLKNWS